MPVLEQTGAVPTVSRGPSTVSCIVKSTPRLRGAYTSTALRRTSIFQTPSGNAAAADGGHGPGLLEHGYLQLARDRAPADDGPR